MSDVGFPAVPPYSQPSVVPAATTPEERNMAMLAHILMIFTGFIGPLIIFFVKRDSRFVRYHSLMALFWQLIVMAFWMIVMVVFFATMFATIATTATTGQTTPGGPPPPMFFAVMGVFWGGGMLVWILNLILGIVYGIKSHDGKWDGYPVIKSWSARAAGV